MKRLYLLLAAGLVIVTVTLIAHSIGLFNWRDPSVTDSGTRPSASASPGVETQSDEEAVAAALVALTEDPARGAAAAVRSSVDPAVALPPGTRLTPVQETWAPDGIGGGTMDVILSLAGKPDERFVAVMVAEDGQWKVLGTLDQVETQDIP